MQALGLGRCGRCLEREPLRLEADRHGVVGGLVKGEQVVQRRVVAVAGGILAPPVVAPLSGGHPFGGVVEKRQVHVLIPPFVMR
ncbi:hypothetical protein D3C86_1395720 [compost metagenome]